MIKEKTQNIKSSNQANPINQGSDNMKQGWEIKKLGEIASFSQGIQVGLEHHLTEPKEGYVRFIRIVDYTQNTDDIRYIPNPGEKYFVNEEDIVMVRYGTPGLIGRGKAGVIANNLFKIKIERKDLTNDYLTLFLSQEHIQNYLGTQGSATMPALNFGQLKTVEVKFPPLPEQQRIVSILEEAFAAIAKAKANAEQNLKNAKELFESYLQGVFEKKGDGWEEKKLGEVIEYDKNQNIHKGLPYVGLEHIESNSGRFIGSLEPQVVKSSTFYFNEQHVLYGRLRPYLNKVLLPDFEGHCSTEIFPIKVGKQVAREFLFYWLIAGSTVKKIDATWTGARMPRANMNQVLEFDFAFPPLKEQQTIVRQLDALRAETQKLEAVYQKKIADLEELKKSILQKAFAGELRGGEPAEPKTEKSRRDDKIIENKINHPRTNPEGVK